ncbi:hypothetical protein GCM10028895_00680 [Pontibacter rugosus]
MNKYKKGKAVFLPPSPLCVLYLLYLPQHDDCPLSEKYKSVKIEKPPATARSVKEQRQTTLRSLERQIL